MKEKIDRAAIQVGRKVLSLAPPARHRHIVAQHNLTGGRKGFLTTEGRFVGRREAHDIALAARQIKKGLKSGELHTEDLW